MPIIEKEIEKRVNAIDLPLDFENRCCDLAIETLSDIIECDESIVYVKWVTLTDKSVPLLYVLFSGTITEKMPRVHIDESGSLHPAHAICLVTMPSGNILNPERMKYVIRKGVEDFLLKYK